MANNLIAPGGMLASVGGSLLVANGPPSCCCGNPCGCGLQPDCGVTSTPQNPPKFVIKGKFDFGINPSFPYGFDERNQLGGCCCGDGRSAVYTRKESFITRWIAGPCAGLILADGTSYEECNAPEGFRKIRTIGRSRTGAGCGTLATTTDIDINQPETNCTQCRNTAVDCIGNFCFGMGEPYLNSGFLFWAFQSLYHITGTFEGSCTHHIVKFVALSGPVGAERETTYSFEAYLDPDTHRCQGPACARACCLPGGICRDDLTAEECRARNGTPMPPGVPCVTIDCAATDPRLKGRCCMPTGECVVTSPAGCPDPNRFGGLGTNCVPNPCAQPVGACCTGQTCSQVTQIICQAAGGAWQGPGSTCTPNPCVVGGACCKRDNTCAQVNDPQVCANLGGIFFPLADCQAITCPQCCFVDEPERTYTLGPGGETIVEGPVTHCCWDRNDYTIGGSGYYNLRLNFNPPGCYAQEQYFSFERQFGQWQLVKRLINYGQGTGSCGNPGVETIERVNIATCTSADVILNLIVGTLASGGTGTRHTTCSTGNADRIDANSGSTATLTASVTIDGGTACSQNCQPGGFRPVFAGDFL